MPRKSKRLQAARAMAAVAAQLELEEAEESRRRALRAPEFARKIGSMDLSQTYSGRLEACGFKLLYSTYDDDCMAYGHKCLQDVAVDLGLKDLDRLVFLEILGAAASMKDEVSFEDLASKIGYYVDLEIDGFDSTGLISKIEDSALSICPRLEKAEFDLPKGMPKDLPQFSSYDDSKERSRIFESIRCVRSVQPHDGLVEFKLTHESRPFLTSVDVADLYKPVPGSN